MKVVIIGNGDMLANLIEGTLASGNEVVGVMRYERVKTLPVLLPLYDFFKTSSVYTLIKEKKLHEIKLRSANSDAFKKELLKLNTDILLID